MRNPWKITDALKVKTIWPVQSDTSVKNSRLVLVTCFYANLGGTILGGRSHRKQWYLDSLQHWSRQMSSYSNVDIVCFTSPEEAAELRALPWASALKRFEIRS